MDEKYTPTDAEIEMAAAIFSIHSAVRKLISRLELSEQVEFAADMDEAAESMQKLVRMWNLKP